MAFGKKIEAFSLSHAQILDGETTVLDALAAAYVAGDDEDIYGVNESSLEPQTDEYENEGDDAVLSTWSWLNYAELTVQAGYLSFPLIAKLTGQTVESSLIDTKAMISLDLWHEDSFNVAPKPVLVRMPAKDENGLPASLVILLYRVQFAPLVFEGPSYKEGLKVNYDGKALFSNVDETGTAFEDGKRRVGRLISIER